MIVDFLRSSDLLNLAVAHDDDAIGHRHGFSLIVRNVNRRCLKLLMQLGDFCAHGDAKLGIKV